MAVRRGALSTSFDFPYHMEEGEPRVHTLIYHSDWAAPHVIVPANAFISVRSAVPNKISTSLRLAGIDQDREIFTSTAGFSESVDEPFRTMGYFDAASYPSGLFPYRLRLTNHFGVSTRSTFISGSTRIVNEVASPFGAGWYLEEAQKLVGDLVAPSRFLLQSGDGETVVLDHRCEVLTR